MVIFVAELRAELKDVNTRKKAFKEELGQIINNTTDFTEEDRIKLCKMILKLIRTSESLEVKKYLKETIAEIKVSNTDVEITLSIA